MVFNKIIRNNKNLLGFIFLSYVDKALYFLLPMLLLYVSEDEQAYNSLEYVCSIGNIIVPFLTFISSYAYYGYKVSGEKQKFSEQYKCFSCVSTIAIGFFTFFVLHLIELLGIRGTETFELFIAIRTMFYIFVQYINSYYRLIDKPSLALLYSIAINFSSALSILAIAFLKCGNTVGAFFYPEVATGVVATLFIVKASNILCGKEYFLFIKKSIMFAWPIVLNSTAVAFVANYGKVYAYNFLSSYDMYCFSFIMRMAMILQMAHAAVISFFSKDIYLNGYSKKFIISYITIMGCSLIGVIVILAGYNNFFAKQIVPINFMSFLVFIYTIFHMIGAVLEVNFGRHNQNKYIFIMSAISCALYMFMIFIIGVRDTIQLALFMLIYMVVYVILLLVTARRIKE